MTAPLAIFDIDGTLCDTVAVDEECFLGALSECLGADASALPWRAAPHVTDRAITEFLWEMRHGRGPTPSEIEGVVERFVRRLEVARRDAPHRFRAVSGAAALTGRLAAAGWSVAVATGGWGRSARLKLDAADLGGLSPLASSDDVADRSEIFRLAHERIEAVRGRRLTRVLLVGDGPWDVRVAAGMGWAFLGVGSGAGAHRLFEAGAARVVPDLTDEGPALAALKMRNVPFSKVL
jgi:phosphoglycolate phosphatase-like HAD superfamily hydrolase